MTHQMLRDTNDQIGKAVNWLLMYRGDDSGSDGIVDRKGTDEEYF